MKVKLTEQQFRRVILKEQDNNYDFVGELYNQVVKASAGWGTDPDAIKLVISKLNPDVSDIHDFLSRFKDKKSGYDSFNKLINGEYDFYNLSDIKGLEKLLIKFGAVEYGLGKNNAGYRGFTKGFKFTPNDKRVYSEKGKECETIYKNQLPNAVKWWEDWLNDPITQQKFKKNHNITSDGDVKLIFSHYKKALNKAYIYPYYDDKSSTIAFVKQKIIAPGRIWVNCSKKDEYDTNQKVLETLIHELQHQLHNIYPINPDKQIGDLFVNSATDKLTPQDFEGEWDKNKSDVLDGDSEYEKVKLDIKKLMSLEDWRRTVKRISLELNVSGNQEISKEKITASWLRYWYQHSVKGVDGDMGYPCRMTEKASNIPILRKTLGMSPTDKLTTQMLKPYILGEKKKLDISWLLTCWAQKGFVTLKSFVTEFNELADTITTGEDSISDTMT